VLKPLNHNVLIRPDAQPEASQGGILLPQELQWVASSGTVLAIGPKRSRLRWLAREKAFQDAVTALRRAGAERAAEVVLTLTNTPDMDEELTVGDRVAFSYEDGVRLVEDGQEYLILSQDDVVVLVEDAEEVQHV